MRKKTPLEYVPTYVYRLMVRIEIGRLGIMIILLPVFMGQNLSPLGLVFPEKDQFFLTEFQAFGSPCIYIYINAYLNVWFFYHDNKLTFAIKEGGV